MQGFRSRDGFGLGLGLKREQKSYVFMVKPLMNQMLSNVLLVKPIMDNSCRQFTW